MFEKEKATADELISEIQEYVDTRQKLARLNAIEKSVSLSTSILIFSMIFIFFLLFMVFAGLAAADIIDANTGVPYSGALCVAGFYLLLMFVLYTGRNSWLRRSIENSMVKNIFKNEDHG